MEQSRKDAIRAYKERKTARGVFAVRCGVTNNVWVDSAMDLDAAQNRIWFVLRLGDVHTEKTIQAEFQEHGRDAFRFEIVETLEEDVEPMAVRDLLKEKKLHWMAQMGARAISPV